MYLAQFLVKKENSLHLYNALHVVIDVEIQLPLRINRKSPYNIKKQFTTRHLQNLLHQIYSE